MAKKLELTRLGVRPDQVAEMVGSKQIVREMVKAGLLVPVVKRHKLTLYDVMDVHRAWAQMLSGKQPNSKERGK